MDMSAWGTDFRLYDALPPWWHLQSVQLLPTEHDVESDNSLHRYHNVKTEHLSMPCSLNLNTIKFCETHFFELLTQSQT